MASSEERERRIQELENRKRELQDSIRVLEEKYSSLERSGPVFFVRTKLEIFKWTLVWTLGLGLAIYIHSF